MRACVHVCMRACMHACVRVHARMRACVHVQVNKMAMEFVRDVQHLSGVPGHTLTAEIQAQAKAFMDLNNDNWTRKAGDAWYPLDALHASPRSAPSGPVFALPLSKALLCARAFRW